MPNPGHAADYRNHSSAGAVSAAVRTADFDVAAATGLYWRQVPMSVRLPDREEHSADLTVRILSGASRTSPASRVRMLPRFCWNLFRSLNGDFPFAASEFLVTRISRGWSLVLACVYLSCPIHSSVNIRSPASSMLEESDTFEQHQCRCCGCGSPSRPTPAFCTPWTLERKTLPA